jgi:putative transcriptional regulator
VPDSPVKNQIRRLRFECGELTQQGLADRVEVTRQTIVSIEGGKYSPSLELAFRIARTLGKPLEEVFQYEDPARSRADSPIARG